MPYLYIYRYQIDIYAIFAKAFDMIFHKSCIFKLEVLIKWGKRNVIEISF